MVQKIEEIFDALHQIILLFFFKLAVFAPALANAVLVGFAVGSFANSEWGFFSGLVSGPIAALAIEGTGLILSWNMKKGTQWGLISLYIVGSWVLIWFGLNDGWLVNVFGFVMPIFAVAVQWTIAYKEKEDREHERMRSDIEIELEKIKEQTKQERAKTRRAKLEHPKHPKNADSAFATLKPVEKMQKNNPAFSHICEICKETFVNPKKYASHMRWAHQKDEVLSLNGSENNHRL